MHARPPIGKLPSAALDHLVAQTVADAPSEPAYGDTDYDDAGNYSTLARADYSPVAWNVYYDTRFQVTCPTRAATFQCYFNYPKDLKPVEPVATPVVGTDRPVLVLVHGAGHSALSFALCARVLAEAGHPVLAFDQRAHGGSIAEDESSAAFSCESLVADAVAVLGQVFTAQHVLVLVGHSMGGALVVRIARTCQTSSIGGVVVVDVVEGTAMAALEHMRGIIQSRPTRFESVTKAIEWVYRSKGVRIVASARVSTPPQLKADPLSQSNQSTVECTDLSGPVVWRTDLFATEPHWRSWFEGLSDAFLSAPGAKLLLLAGTDRLDKPLLIGQMQGKFQLVVLSSVGHTIQEDAPDKVAITISEFVSKRSTEFMKVAALNAKLRAAKAAKQT